MKEQMKRKIKELLFEILLEIQNINEDNVNSYSTDAIRIKIDYLRSLAETLKIAEIID